VEVDLLVNNAGYMISSYYHEKEWNRHADFIQVMVTAVAQLTHLFLPPMIERGYGRIVNVASLAGLVPGSAGYTLYGAAKSFLIKMSESLSQELEGTGVHVTATCPGFTYSELHDVAGNRAQFNRELPGYLWMEADPVVAETIAASDRGDPVCVPGRINQALALVSKLSPSRLLMRFMGERSKKLVPR
jgi:short-subunit dehydrogenase